MKMHQMKLPAFLQAKTAGPMFAVLIGLYATLFSFLVNPRFYFNDDEQNNNFAYFIDIGQHLRVHQWPGITLSTFYGENLLNDWQFGLLNPFSLLVYLTICSGQNLLLIGLVIFLIYLPILSLGGYCLGRAFGLRRLFSLSIGAALVTNNFLQYVYCDSWSIGLFSITWFIWVWALLERYRNGGGVWVLAGLIGFMYLTVTSGFPHSTMMMGILVVVYLAEIITVQGDRARALRLFLVSVGAFLTTMPCLLPALLSFSWMVRPSGIHSGGIFMPDFGSFLNLSAIFFIPRLHLYAHEYPSYPIMYLAWYIGPLLPFFCWRNCQGILRERWGLAVFGIVGFIMLFGPENLGPIRYPIRFLPYIHTTILIFFFLFLSSREGVEVSKTRIVASLVIWLAQFYTSFSAYPDSLYIQLGALAGLLIVILCAIRFLALKNHCNLGMLILIVTGAVFSFTHLLYPRNQDLADFQPVLRNNAAAPTVSQPFTGYNFYAGPLVYANCDDVHIAAQEIYRGKYTINGYSAIRHVGLTPRVHCDNWFEMNRETDPDFLFAIEPTTQRSILSLMRVNHLQIYNSYLGHIQPLLGAEWMPVSKGVYATEFKNGMADTSNTTVSYASDGIRVRSTGEVTGEWERLQVTADRGGQLVFARPYWPGYRAKLNGRPLSVSPLDQLFVKVDLPPGSNGEFILSFVPPGWNVGLGLAALGLALCAWTLLNAKKVSIG